jgi:hypothetical protein
MLAHYAPRSTTRSRARDEATRIAASLVVTLAWCACSVDDRQLQLAPSDDAAAGTGGELDASSGGSGSEDAAGAADATDGLVEGCADLDTDGVPDCTQTILKNPTFTSNVDDWKADGDARLAWDSKNALADRPSGSAKISAGGGSPPRASVSQCVALSGEQLVIAYASTFVEPAGDAGTLPHATLLVSFFSGSACTGTSDAYFETPPSSVTGAWTTIQAGGLSSSTTSSVSIALVGTRAASATELNVYFDNVMLRKQTP